MLSKHTQSQPFLGKVIRIIYTVYLLDKPPSLNGSAMVGPWQTSRLHTFSSGATVSFLHDSQQPSKGEQRRVEEQ